MTHALNYYSDFVLNGNQYIIQLHFGTEREPEREREQTFVVPQIKLWL